MAETRVRSELAATVWRIEVAEGDHVAAGATLLLLESMKMEIPVVAPVAGTVRSIFARPEQQVSEGEALVLLDG